MRATADVGVLVGLVILLCRIKPSTAIGGSLFKMDFSALLHSTLPDADDTNSGALSTNGGFAFGTATINNVYVCSNGYISMDVDLTNHSPLIPDIHNIVSPYGADIDTRIAGTVRYTNGFIKTSAQMPSIIYFIKSQTNDYSFNGETRMLAVEWDSVAKLNGDASSSATFQAVLITNGTTSYAVFIYQCRGMGWGGATIGWAYSGSLYEKHSLSGSNSASIGCRHSSTYSALVYKLNRGVTTSTTSVPCHYFYFACYNGRCVPNALLCNYINDCGDNSDEEEEYCGSVITACSYYHFTCSNGRCVLINNMCDGHNDCGDNSDEQNCGNDCFGCDNGQCVEEVYKCNGNDDCGDNSDEKNCSTSVVTPPSCDFTCDNGQCVSESNKCNGRDNCGDNSDEENCGASPPHTSCSKHYFTCNNGQCLSHGVKCDKYDDCGDGSDEENCANVGLAIGLSVAVSFLATLVGVSICVIVGVYLVVKKRRSKIPQTRVVTNSTSVNPSTAETSFSTPPNEYFSLPSITGLTSVNQVTPSTAETSFTAPPNEYFSLPRITGQNTTYGERLPSNCPTVAGYAAEGSAP